MKSSLLLGCAAMTLVLSASATANEYDTLLRAKKFTEAEQAANARLAKEAGNAHALIAKSEAILGLGSEERLDEAVKLSEQCVAANPANANCHVALGTARGAKAMNGGMLSAASLAGKIRDGFKKAVELDPRNIDARYSLLQFYLVAPGFMGGGTEKAEALITQTMAVNPEAGKLMMASLDLRADRVPKAEAAVLAARPGADLDLKKLHEAGLMSVGSKHMSEKRYGDAERLFREAQKQYPETGSGAYYIARNYQEQGKHREAVSAFEELIAAYPRPHLHYRLAKSQQALGDKTKAVAAFEKALAYKTGLYKQFKTDSETQLKALKG